MLLQSSCTWHESTKLSVWNNYTNLLIDTHKHYNYTYPIQQNFWVGKLSQFSWFFTQLQIYPRELFEYVIPFKLHTTWHYSSILKCKKIGLYIPSLNIEQDCWSWSYWSSQWGGNGSVENVLNVKHYYINTIPIAIPWTEGKPSPYLSPYLKATPTQKALVARYAAVWLP